MEADDALFTSSSSPSPSGATDVAFHYRAVANAAHQLVASFDEIQLHLAATVESVYHQLKEVLHQTRHSGPLSRTRIDCAIQLLLTLAAASPHAGLLTSLIQNLIHSIYLPSPLNPDTPPTSTSHLPSHPTFFEQVKSLQRKHHLLFKDLQRISAQVDYYDRNAGGHREALVIAIKKWQRQCVYAAFRQWRQNVRVLGIQRTRLKDVMRGWETKSQHRRLRSCMRQWKMSVLRHQRVDLMPVVLDARQQSEALSESIQASTHYIEQSQLRLGSLMDDISEMSKQCNAVASNVAELQAQIQRYGCFRLADVAHHTLELIREMMVGLQDELEYGRQAWVFDPFRLLYKGEGGVKKEVVVGGKGVGKKGKAGRKKEKEREKEREEEEERERKVIMTLDTTKYEQKFAESQTPPPSHCLHCHMAHVVLTSDGCVWM